MLFGLLSGQPQYFSLVSIFLPNGSTIYIAASVGEIFGYSTYLQYMIM